MAMDGHEREVRALLRDVGAKFVRVTGGGQEMYRLPGGQHYFCNKTGHASDWRSWRNALSDLRKLLGPAEEEVETFEMKAVAGSIAVGASPVAVANAIREVEPELFNPPRLVTAPPWEPEETVVITEAEIIGAFKEAEAELKAETENQKTEKTMTTKKKPFDPWTREQMKVLREAFDAGLTSAETAQMLQDLRPGVSAGSVSGKWSYEKWTRPTNKQAIAAVSAPTPLASPLVKVTFETTSGSVKVIQVDRATAEKMIALAVQL